MIRLSYADFLNNISARNLNIQEVVQSYGYDLYAFDEQLHLKCILEDSTDVADYESNYQSSANNKLKQPGQQIPFASKVLPDGKKLFKRVHGVSSTIAANSSDSIEIIVPYAQCKITSIEILGSIHGDTCDFNVYDNAAGTVSTVPNLKLNQFGFNVYMAEKYHKEESSYDADLIQGMKLEVVFTNSTNEASLIGVNFILHELKS